MKGPTDTPAIKRVLYQNKHTNKIARQQSNRKEKRQIGANELENCMTF